MQAMTSEDDEEQTYAFNFMISGVIHVYAKTDEEAEALIRQQLEIVEIGGQEITTEIETLGREHV
jgi:hypothetical protein